MTLRRPAALLLLALTAPLAAGESQFEAASTLNPLQALGNAARPLAMGSAFTAVGGDIASLYFNPAGLARLKGSRMSANHNSWIDGVQQETLLFALGAPAISFGFTGDLVNYGEMPGFDENGNPTPAFTPVDYSVGATLAREFGNGLSLGLAGRGTQQNIRDTGQLSLSADLGGQYHAAGGMGFGISYANLGPAVNGHRPTGALRFGASYTNQFMAGYGLLVAAAMAGMSNGQQQFQLGAEGRIADSLLPRIGYQVNFFDPQLGGFSGLSAGLGFKLGSLELDYAFLPYGIVGQAHRFSLAYNFIDSLANPAAARPKALAPAPAPQGKPEAPENSAEMVFEVEEVAAPKDAGAWRALGAFYYKEKRHAEAVAAFEKAFELNPADKALGEWLKKVNAPGNKSKP